jgi:segregation and condensation protein B
LPDVDVIDDLSETLADEPRFVKLSTPPAADGKHQASFDVDTD